MKKIISILLACAMMLGLLAGCGSSGTDETVQTTGASESVPRQTPEIKFHEPAAEFAGGSGTEADPYQISNASQLALLNQRLIEDSKIGDFDDAYISAYYILTADISLNDTSDFDSWAVYAPEYGWEPIGRTADGFNGVFDGNGHTISGMYINADAGLEEDVNNRNYGLFAEISGTVKNLTVEKSYIRVSGAAKNVGAVAGNMVSDEAVVENCASSAVIEVCDDGNAGGVAGSGSGVITNCRFGGSITQLDGAWSHLGGICGYGSQITGCTNLGSISGSGYSGGIVGWGSNVSECANRGSVSGDTAGGISGNMYETGTGLEITVTGRGLWNCVNEGQVNGVSYAGGIAGKVGNDEADIDMYVTGCENYGQVSCDATAAGIIGLLSPERAGILKVENCKNHADITGKDKVGGIICELTGAILNQKGDVTITGCENNGNITSTEGMYSGGIVTYFVLMGAETDLRLTIENCTNTGSISSQCNAGGILCFSTSSVSAADGIFDASAITLRGCVNSGGILGLSTNSYVGGIAANFTAEGIPTLFENCINTGDVRLELSLTEEEIQATLDSDVGFTISQMVGGIVGRLGEGLLLTTDHDEGSASNVNAENAWIVFRGCYSSGKLGTTDYSEYKTEDGRQIFKNYVGGIVGNASAEDDYSFRVEDCGYANADRGLGNEAYPDVGSPMSVEAIEDKLPG